LKGFSSLFLFKAGVDLREGVSLYGRVLTLPLNIGLGCKKYARNKQSSLLGLS